MEDKMPNCIRANTLTPSPWTGSRGADRSGSVSLKTPVPAICHGVSCGPRRALGCRRGCRSAQRRADLPCKVPAVDASLCSCRTRKTHEVRFVSTSVLKDQIKFLKKRGGNETEQLLQWGCCCGGGLNINYVWIAASHLRSLSRAEMVVRRRPLSLLDSAVAIWYSSFSMEKGLAIRRHFRSWTQSQIVWFLRFKSKRQQFFFCFFVYPNIIYWAFLKKPCIEKFAHIHTDI